MSTESSPEAWRDLAGPFLIWVLRLFPIFQTRFLKTWIQSRWFSFNEWLKKEMDTYAWFNQVIFWGYCSLRKENIFPNDSQVVPKRSWYSKEASFPVFQKALLHSVLITILNHPHNHHHKNIWILRVQKPFINRAEINSVLFSFTDCGSEEWRLWCTLEFRGPVCFLINVEFYFWNQSFHPITKPHYSVDQKLPIYEHRGISLSPGDFFLNCPADFRITLGQGTLSCN